MKKLIILGSLIVGGQCLASDGAAVISRPRALTNEERGAVLDKVKKDHLACMQLLLERSRHAETTREECPLKERLTRESRINISIALASIARENEERAKQKAKQRKQKKHIQAQSVSTPSKESEEVDVAMPHFHLETLPGGGLPSSKQFWAQAHQEVQEAVGSEEESKKS